MMSETTFDNLQVSHVEPDSWEGLVAGSNRKRRSSKDSTSSRVSKTLSKEDFRNHGQEQPAIDLEALAERCMDDFDLLVEVIESFCEQCLTRVNSLEKSLLNSDTEQLSFDLDFLSGAAKNIGAQSLDDSILFLSVALAKRHVPSIDEAEEEQPSEEDTTALPRTFFGLVDEIWRPAFSGVVMEFQRAVKYWKDFRIQTGNDDVEDMASTLRLESFLASCTCSDGMENGGSNWSATEDELAHHRHIDDDMRTGGEERSTPVFSDVLFANPDWNSTDAMDLFFEGAKQTMSFVRECWLAGRRDVIKGPAEAMNELSAQAGLTTLNRKLTALVNSAGPGLRVSHIDAVDQQLDASIAIWSSCRLKI